MVHVKYVSIELVSGARVCLCFEILKSYRCILIAKIFASKHNHNPLDLSELRHSRRASECMRVSLTSLHKKP